MDKAEQHTDTDDEAPGAASPRRDPVSTALGILILCLVGLPAMLLAQRAFGLWEPWETVWAELAREMRETGEWFHPTLSGRSTPRPLLPIWLVAAGQALFGGSELGMRLPMGVAVVSGCAALFVWLRGIFGGFRGLIAGFAALTCPTVFLTGTTLAGHGAWIGALMGTVALYGILLAPDPGPEGKGQRAPLLVGLGVMLSVDVLAQGLWGLWLPALIIAAVGLAARLRDHEEGGWGGRDTLAVASISLVALGTVALGISSDWEGAAVELMPLVVPALLIAGLAVLAWPTRAIQVFARPAGLMALLLPMATLGALVALFGAGAPEDPLGLGPSGLAALTESPLLTPKALPDHVDFDFWVRQMGFAAYPWAAFLPLGLVYLLRHDERVEGASDGALPGEDDALRLIAQWFAVSLAVAMLLGTAHEVYLFPAVSSVGVAVSLALTDAAFWAWMRKRPLLFRIIGFSAVLVVLFLSKDLERYPKELLGPLLTDGKIELPEDFTFGRALKVFRYGLVAILLVWFMDALSWPAKVRAWRSGRRVDASPSPVQAAEPHTQEAGAAHQGSRLDGESLSESVSTPHAEGAHAWIFRAERLSGRPEVLAVAIALVGLGFVVMAGGVWVPSLSHHLSQRGLLETYEAHKGQGEALATYQVSTHQASYYFSDIDKIPNITELKRRFQADERVFVVLPRDRLASLNYEVRKGTKPRRNLHVIDDRSSRYVLASNLLREGEDERSQIAWAILDERPRPVYQLAPLNEKKERQFPQFDKKLQILGYEVYHQDEVDKWGNPSTEATEALSALKKAGGRPVYKAGEKLVIRYYFKVLRRVTSSQKVFLHVDLPGNRINGDHVPVNEQFPTNYWLPGDYVVDTQWLAIEPGSQAGIYTMYMGFFLGSRRMAVTPPSGHDGSDRVKLGQIEVENF